MTEKRFTVFKKLENSDIEGDVIDTYIERLVKDGKSVGWVTMGILDNGSPITYKDCVDLLNENEQLKTQLQNTSDQRNEFHRAARENANRAGKLENENEWLKRDNNALIHLLENQAMIIEELHSKLLEYQIKEPIVLTKEDLNLMGKAISYYTHGRYAE